MAELALAVGASAGTAATIGQIATVVSAVSGMGSILTGIAGNRQASAAEAGAHAANARIAQQNAEIAESQNKADIERQRRAAVLRTGAATAAGFAQGGGGGGNIRDVLTDNATQEELDILTLKHQGKLTKNAFLQDAALGNMAASTARRNLPAQNAATILSGASRLFGAQVV